jgi:ABC-type antimicrobial peptide transport system permease subunit
MRRLGLAYRIHHLFHNIFKNKVRFFLVIFGLVLPGVLLMSAYFALDSIYYSNFNEYQHYQELNLFEVSLNSSESRPLIYLQDELGSKYISYKHYTEGRLAQFDTANQSISVYYDLIQTSSQFTGDLIVYGDYVMPSEIILGRTFTAADFIENRSVVIIDSILSGILFDDVSPLGQMMQVPIYGYYLEQGVETYGIAGYQSLEIIGVVQAAMRSQVQFIDNLEATEDFSYETSFYVTSSFLIDGLDEPEDITYVFYDTKEISRMSINFLSGIPTGTVVYGANYFDGIVYSIQEEYQTLKLGFVAVAVVLLLISMVSIISIMIFAVKERIGEIGVKKAFGASKVKVMIDFLIEGIMTSFFAFLISLVVSVYLVYIGFYIFRINNPSLYFYDVFIHFDTIILTFLLINISSLIATIIPASYAAKINISDAIKFE